MSGTPIYNKIGSSYNSTRKADPAIVALMLAKLRPAPEGKYLDLACGTGNYTLAYKKSGLSIVGVDQSELMIERAKSREPSVSWRIGEAENLPFENSSFNGVLCTNAIHHFKNLRIAVQECSRVLSFGNLVIFCSTQEQMRSYWLNHYFPLMMKKSIEQMPKKSQIVEALEQANFETIECEAFFIKPDLQDLFLYSGKHRPELYLEEEFRKNISSFAALADAEEIEGGLQALASDIESGRIKSIIADFESTSGDYLVVSATREKV